MLFTTTSIKVAIATQWSSLSLMPTFQINPMAVKLTVMMRMQAPCKTLWFLMTTTSRYLLFGETVHRDLPKPLLYQTTILMKAALYLNVGRAAEEQPLVPALL
jgi:hypothetical protein